MSKQLPKRKGQSKNASQGCAADTLHSSANRDQVLTEAHTSDVTVGDSSVGCGPTGAVTHIQGAASDLLPPADANEAMSRDQSAGASAGISSTHCGQVRRANHAPAVAVGLSSGGEGQGERVAHSRHADAPAFLRIREYHRKRVDLHRAEKALTLRIKAVCRRFCDGDKDEAEVLYKALGDPDAHEHSAHASDWVAPLIASRDMIEAERKKPEKLMAKEAKALAAWPWVESVGGFGALGFAQIIGEAGDLRNYSNPAKLWKRMGLAVINGGRQRKIAGDEALLHGYSPDRRSIVWNVGACVIKYTRGPNAYRDLYLARKVVEQSKVPDGTKALWHNRAKRYMEKRLLRDLWRAFRNEPTTDRSE